MGGSKRKGNRREKKGRKVAFILIPSLLALFLVFYIFLKMELPGKKPARLDRRAPIFMGKVTETEKETTQRPSPKLALIIDDGGYSMDKFRGMLGTGKPITFAILPHALHAREAALLAHQEGSEVMLHLPMEPHNGEYYGLEKNTVRTGMESWQIRKIVEEALTQVPHVRGVNNHMGSRATQDPRLMRALMSVLRQEGLYFIDSSTNSQSYGPEMARKAGVAFGRNNRFIDPEKEIGTIKDALRFVMRKAKREGKAVAIGHPHPVTARAIREMIPEIEKEGIQFVFASEVVR